MKQKRDRENKDVRTTYQHARIKFVSILTMRMMMNNLSAMDDYCL